MPLLITFVGFTVGVTMGYFYIQAPHINIAKEKIGATDTINVIDKSQQYRRRGIIESVNLEEKFLIINYKSDLDYNVSKKIQVYFDEKTEVIEEIHRQPTPFDFKNFAEGHWVSFLYTQKENYFYVLEISHHISNPLKSFLLQ